MKPKYTKAELQEMSERESDRDRARLASLGIDLDSDPVDRLMRLQELQRELRRQRCYDPAMHIDIEAMPEREVRTELNKYLRLFDVAYSALLISADLSFPGDRQKIAADACALIDRYPDDERYVCGASKPAASHLRGPE